MITSSYLPARADRKASAIELQEVLARKWPEAISPVSGAHPPVIRTGVAAFDSLFPWGGVPIGQLIELTGTESSGKTGFLLQLLTGITRQGNAVYIDCSGSFFPVAARYAGVDLRKLLIVTPNSDDSCLRAAEQLLSDRFCLCVVFDFSRYHRNLSLTQVHRLRLKVSRARGLAVFLTQDNSQIIPASMTSLRLHIERDAGNAVILTVARSRICPEGVTVKAAV